MCVRYLLCVLYGDATQRYEGRIGGRAGTLEMFEAETNQRKISRERLAMPPSAESCPKGTLQVCVKAGREPRKTSTVLFVQTPPPMGQFFRAGN